MGKNSLDKHFRDQLYDHKTPTDPELIWQNIQSAKGGTPFGKTVISMLIPIILIIGAALVIGLMNDQSKDTAELGTNNEIQNNLEHFQSSNTKTVVVENYSTRENINESDNTGTSDNSKLSTIGTSHLSEATKTSNDKIIDEGKSTVIGQTNTQSDIKGSSEENPNQTAVTAQNVNNESGNNILDTDSYNENKKRITTADVADKSSQLIDKGNEIQNNPTSEESAHFSAAVQAEIQESKVSPKSSISEISLIDRLNPELKFTAFDVPEIQLNRRARKPYNYSSPWDLSLGVYGSYGLTDKMLSTSDTNAEAYLSQRNTTESSLEAIGFGIDVKASKWNSFYLKTGLSYNQINERFDLRESRDSTYIDDNQIIRIVVNSNGDSIPEFGSAEVTETYFFQKRIHNYYRFFDVPVTAGFEYISGGLSYFIEAGASLNFMFTQKGEIYDASLLPYSIKDDNQNYFKSNAGISLIGAFGLAYRISDQLSFSAQTLLKYQLGKINSSNNPIDQKYITLGLQAGLRFHLGQ